MIIPESPCLLQHGLSLFYRSGHRAPGRGGFLAEHSEMAGPRAASTAEFTSPGTLSSTPGLLVYRTRYVIRGNFGHAPAGVTALEAWAARIFLVAGVPFPRIGSGLIRAFSWGFCSSPMVGPMVLVRKSAHSCMTGWRSSKKSEVI